MKKTTKTAKTRSPGSKVKGKKPRTSVPKDNVKFPYYKHVKLSPYMAEKLKNFVASGSVPGILNESDAFRYFLDQVTLIGDIADDWAYLTEWLQFHCVSITLNKLYPMLTQAKEKDKAYDELFRKMAQAAIRILNCTEISSLKGIITAWITVKDLTVEETYEKKILGRIFYERKQFFINKEQEDAIIKLVALGYAKDQSSACRRVLKDAIAVLEAANPTNPYADEIKTLLNLTDKLKTYFQYIKNRSASPEVRQELDSFKNSLMVAFAKLAIYGDDDIF